MKKTLFVCATAVCLTACIEQPRDTYVTGYEYVPAYTTGCSTCAQPVTTCNTCVKPIQPVLHQEPKTIVVMVPPAPQPVIEPEIIYQPQPACACNKCGCQKAGK